MRRVLKEKKKVCLILLSLIMSINITGCSITDDTFNEDVVNDKGGDLVLKNHMYKPKREGINLGGTESLTEVLRRMNKEKSDGVWNVTGEKIVQSVTGTSSMVEVAVLLAGLDVIKTKWDRDGPNSRNLNKPIYAKYKEIKNAMFPGDKYYASCDRAIATAVRFSGVDTIYPIGDTAVQYNYLKNSPMWDYIGDYGKIALKPGDVLITKGKGHTKMYVGNEAVQARFPGSNSDMFAASYHDYFPRLYKDKPSYDARTYAVYRHKGTVQQLID